MTVTLEHVAAGAEASRRVAWAKFYAHQEATTALFLAYQRAEGALWHLMGHLGHHGSEGVCGTPVEGIADPLDSLGPEVRRLAWQGVAHRDWVDNILAGVDMAEVALARRR